MIVTEIARRLRVAKGDEPLYLLACLTPAVVKDLYRNTAVDAPVRRFIVDVVVKYGKAASVMGLGVQYPVEFVQSVLVGAFRELEKVRAKAAPSVDKGANKTVRWNQGPLTTRSSPSELAAGILKAQVAAVPANQDAELMWDDCAYHEHIRLGWPCSKVKPWG